MIETIQNLNHIFAIGGISVIFVTAILVFDLLQKQIARTFIQVYGLYIAFFVAIGSATMTLLYSEYFGVIPCGLCWLERVMLYPQILLLGFALCAKDKLVARYGIVLSGAGIIIALYHHFIQMGGTQFVRCPAAGAGADCAKRFIFEFGFVTFPLLASILFAFLIALYFYILKTREV
jgi:disulfide bond formation protein DsbB